MTTSGSKKIQQFHRHLKAEQLDRRILQTIVLQLHNDFALLHYFFFSSIGTTHNNDTSLNNSASSLPTDPNFTSIALPIPRSGAPSVRPSTPEGAVGYLRAKANNFANANYQSSPNTREAPPTTEQNLASRISQLEKLFTDGIATYTSITKGIHSQYFFLYNKIHQLEAGNSDAIVWKIPSMKFVFDSAEKARPSTDFLVEPAKSFSGPIFRTHPHGYNLSNFTLMALDPLLASVLQSYSHSSLLTTTICFPGPSQSSSTLVFVINWIHWTPGWRQFGLINTRPTRSPQSQQTQESQQSASLTLLLTLNSSAELKVF